MDLLYKQRQIKVDATITGTLLTISVCVRTKVDKSATPPLKIKTT